MREITLDDVKNRATPQSFSRGEEYYNNGAIFDTVRRGNVLEGRCEGSDYDPYYVRVMLDEASHLEAALCTCPYDWGGDCKHIVALLLAYLHSPELFEARAPVQTVLAEFSKEQLVTLILLLVDYAPELATLIDQMASEQ